MQTKNGAPTTEAPPAVQAPLVVAPPSAPARQALPLVPTNLDEAWRFSEALSRSELVPPQYQGKAANVLAAFYMAADLGISAMQAMREIHVVEGKPSASSALKVALVKQSPLCLKWECVETTKEKATFTTQRHGDLKPTTLTFTIQQARDAGLIKPKSGWEKFPENMLRARAASFLADLVYPDVVKGLRTTEEVQEIEKQEREIPGERVASETFAPPAPTQAPSSQTVEHAAAETEPASPAPTSPEAPATPDVAEVILNELEVVDTLPAIDALSKRATSEVPKTHPLRKKLGEAFNAARARVKQS